jgi:RNA-directed DNA polymerase
VDWRRCEEEVRRLRSRIFKAVQERDMATAVDLQKLMVRHEALLFRMEVEDLDL